MTWAMCIVGAYLIGSIPFGVIIGLARGVDIRMHGSRNIGATNVARVLGKPWGLICFALDFLKGAAPVLLAGVINGVIDPPEGKLTAAQMWLWLAVAAAAVVGHMFPIALAFRGGKGVATAFGALAAMWPLLTVAVFGALVVWYVTLRITRYVSVASMVGAASIPVWCLVGSIPRTGEDIWSGVSYASPPIIVTAAMAGLVVYKHRTNIARLRRGEEPQVGGAARRGAVG